MNKKYSFGILLVSLLLIMSSVLAETWTFNDTGLSGSSSGTFLDFTNKALQVNNASFVNNISVDGRVLDTTDFNSWDAFDYSGYDQDLNSTNNVEFGQVTTGSVVQNSTHDNSNTFIRNSNGKYWTATGANIQNAIDDLTSGEVHLPSGEISWTTGVLTMKSGVDLIGHDTTIKVTSSTGESYLVYCNQLNNFSITGITIDCQDNVGNPLYIRGCSNGLFRDIYLYNSSSNGFYMVEDASDNDNIDMIVENIYVYHAARSASSGLEAFGIRNTQHSVFRNLWSVNCSNSDGTYTPPYSVDFSDGVENCTVDGVFCRNGGGMKIWADDVGADDNCHNIYKNLQFNTIFTAQATDTAALWVSDDNNANTHHNIIDGVIIQNVSANADYGIQLSNVHNITLKNFEIFDTANVGFHFDTCQDCKIETGNIDTTGAGGWYMKDLDRVECFSVEVHNTGNYNNALRLNECKYFGCTFDNNAAQIGLSLNDDGEGVLFDGCTFSNNNYGIYTQNNPHNFTVTKCYFRDNSADDIEITSGCQWYIITNNNAGDGAIDDNGGGVTKTVSGNLPAAS